MHSIKLLFHIAAKQEIVFWALDTLEGLRGWWTQHVSGDTAVNGFISFDFPPNFFNKMKVVKRVPHKSLQWECVEGAEDWIGTLMTFELDWNEDKTRVRFAHSGWSHNDDFYAACTFGWGNYLSSLRHYVERGKGHPYSEGKS